MREATLTRDPDLTYCANGHIMVVLGGTNCGCYPDATCSFPVFSCRECGDSDYGDNKISRLKKSMCEEARECAKKAPAPEELPPLHLSKAEFSALDEYSATHPSGVVIGKRWRRHDGAYDPSCKKPVWLIGEYVALFDRDDCAMIKWYVPVIKIDAPLLGGDA